MIKSHKIIFSTLFVALMGIALVASLLTIQSRQAHAISGSDWQAGNIITDPLFYDNTTMSVSDIQSFLTSKVSNCDTNGTQSAADDGYPNLTHAQYAAQSGWPGPPYICLQNYMQVPNSSQIIDNYSGSVPSGAISAAQIIKNAADSYKISPKVLITTLQKESLNLIFDNWPLQSQYKNAMGYGCPDTAPCDPSYAGFYNQVNNAARQFSLYRTNPTSYRYQPFMNNNIQFNPNAGCGSSSVYVSDYSTAGLYNYTPYQPNQAALNNLYGSGDGCSAYGNRNFWRIYNDWFGPTTGGEPAIGTSVDLTKALAVTPNGSNDANQTYTATFTLHNNSGSTIHVGWMTVSVRDSNNFNLDFPLQYITIAPNSDYTYSASRTFQWSDNMSAYINGNLTQGIGWSTSIPGSSTSQARTANFRVGSDVVIADPGIQVTQNNGTSSFTATTTFINRTTSSRDIGWYMVSARTPFGKNIDFPSQDIVVPANGTATYTQTEQIDLSDLGTFKFFANLNDTSPGGYGWTTNYPGNNSIWVNRSATYRNGPNIIESSPLAITTDATGASTATIGFTNQGSQNENLGWVIISTRRDGDQTNYDFAPQSLSLAAGESKTLTFKQQLLRAGSYTSTLIFNRPSGWTNTYAPPAQSTITRSATFSSNYAAALTKDIALSTNGNIASAAVTLTNNSQANINLGWVIISVRDSNNNNYDLPGMWFSLNPGETKTLSSSRTLPTGSYSSSITTYQPSYGWGNTFDTTGFSYQKTWTIN